MKNLNPRGSNMRSLTPSASDSGGQKDSLHTLGMTKYLFEGNKNCPPKLNMIISVDSFYKICKAEQAIYSPTYRTTVNNRHSRLPSSLPEG